MGESKRRRLIAAAEAERRADAQLAAAIAPPAKPLVSRHRTVNVPPRHMGSTLATLLTVAAVLGGDMGLKPPPDETP